MALDPNENPMGLGGMVAPRSEQGGGSWTSMLQDPVARSALLSFGLQAMTGGWGNGTQQLAAAVGAGAQGAEGTANAIRAQEVNNRDFAAKQAEGEANRASHEKIAKSGQASREEIAQMNAANRMEIQGLRGDTRLEAERIKLGRAASNDAIKYRAEARKIVEGNVKNMGLEQTQREQMIEELANRMYGADEARGLVKSGQKPSAAAPGGVPPAESSTGYRTDVTLDQIMSSPKSAPDAQQKMRTPEGRAALQKMFPHITPQQIDQYAKNHYLY